MTKTFPTFAAAVAAWVQGELQAALDKPSEMLAVNCDVLRSFMPCRPPTLAPRGIVKFESSAFLDHVDGMLEDLMSLAWIDGCANEPTLLVVESPSEGRPDNLHEWTWCLQGWARLQIVVTK